MNAHACIAVTAFTFAGIAQAAPRTSATYSIVAETAGSGGGAASSATYTQEGSTGAVTGVSALAAGAMKHGFVAQLTDVTGLVVNAPASSLNETGQLQLAVWQVLDDATFLSVPATAVAWSVASGPIAGVGTSGLATAAPVASDTQATVAAAFSGFSASLNLTIVDSVPDNFGAYSGDGLSDAWQVQYFGAPPNPTAAPAADPDGDGQSNAFEFAAGLVPTDATSAFRLRIDSTPGAPLQRRLTFSPRLPDRTYNVRSATSLAAPVWQPLTNSTSTDIGAERTVTDLNATGPRRFYRIEISPP